jgi:hypothetical protein
MLGEGLSEKKSKYCGRERISADDRSERQDFDVEFLPVNFEAMQISRINNSVKESRMELHHLCRYN